MNRIRELRIAKGMKQADIAAALNCAPTAVSKYELGQLDISSSTIRTLCQIFGVTADYLLGLSSLPSPELSEEETALLLAWRRADDRARDMVRLALQPFLQEAGSSETA